MSELAAAQTRLERALRALEASVGQSPGRPAAAPGAGDAEAAGAGARRRELEDRMATASERLDALIDRIGALLGD